jgi:hypothetical protein
VTTGNLGRVLPPEARWLAERMGELEVAELSPLLNVGSSTENFRAQTQPYVQREIFDGLRSRGVVVVHSDRFSAPGIDVAGDLMDSSFMERLREHEPRSVLVSNLLEHVRDPARVARAIVDILPDGAFLFVSGPLDFPHHPDPIDNGLRPSTAELAALFPRTRVLHSAMLAADPMWRWSSEDRGGRSVAHLLARLCVPIYKPRDWIKAARLAPYLVRPATAVAVVLIKDCHEA